MLSMKTEINASKLRTGHIEAKDYHKLATASREISSLPFLIDDTPALSIAAVRAKARRMKRKHGLALLVVDYLQLMRGHGNQKEANRVQEISEISQGLKAIAKELQIPVIALSQLSRAVEQREDKRPQLSDLRESGSIEQDADLVLFIYREEYYLARQQPQDIGSERYQEWQAKLEKVANKADVIIAKHRNGPIGHASLRFDAATTRFSNLDEEISPERENQLIGQRYQPV
jgi:replicative DNA helicase